MYLISPLVVVKVSDDIGQICELEGAQFVLLKDLNYIEMMQLWEARGITIMPMKLGQGIVTLGLHLEFSAKLRIWQVPTCKMEPQSGIIL